MLAGKGLLSAQTFKVLEVLVSGDYARIAEWRAEQSRARSAR